MKMQLGDIVDRWSILMLKKHIGNLDCDAELELYVREIHQNEVPVPWLMQMLMHNAMIWSLEADIRAAKEGRLTMEEIGKRTLDIRAHNTKRIALKNEISKAAGGFIEQRVNHASGDLQDRGTQ